MLFFGFRLGVFAMAAVAALLYGNPAVACPVRDQRVCEVYERVQKVAQTRQIVWSEGSTTHPSIAAEYEWALGPTDVIHLGNTRDLDDQALFFLVAHELGHSHHNHGRQLVVFLADEPDKTLPDLQLVQKYAAYAVANPHRASALRHKQEFEADAFAVRVMLAHGHDPLSAMQSVLRGQFSSILHPSRRARLDRAAEVISATKVALRN